MPRILFVILSLAASMSTLAQEDPRRPSAEDIVNRLKPAPAVRTRSLGHIESKGIQIEGPNLATPPATQTIDLEVNFEYASATLSPDARLVLDNLGKALADPALKASRFQVAGHTDAAGSETYNIALSKRRAQAAAEYLRVEHGIEASRLDITGFGATRLLDIVNPLSAVNRRVQVVNLGVQ